MQNLPAVRDYMDTKVPSLAPATLVLDAVDFLLEHHVTGAPVVDENGTVVGILTEKDCLRIVAHGPEADQVGDRVADYMSRDVRTVPPDMDVYFAAGLFLKARFRRFPVVENGRLVGAITRYDILRAIRAHREYWSAFLARRG